MRDHPLVQLTLARMREFYREPEAIFWVFGFPIVLAFALGIAFKNRGPGELKVGVVRAAGDSALATTLDRSPALAATVLDTGAARVPLRPGRTALLGGFGWWIFDVGVRGSVAALAAITILGSLSFAGLGMLVASRARTIEAVSGLMNLVMLPMWILSGTFFSYARFPDAMQPLVRALPLTALNHARRAVMIDGAPLVHLGAPLGVVTAWGVVSFAVALKIFRWR